MQRQCAQMLEGVLDCTAASLEHQETMGALLPSILSGLVTSLEHYETPEASSAAEPRLEPSPEVLNLINKLVLKVRASLLLISI